jgi:hypothetical protein
LDCIPSAENNLATEVDAAVLVTEFNLDYTSCVGAHIYLALTRMDIIHAVNKLAKFTRHPGKVHFMA